MVSTANYEARKYGVHSAMPLRTAFKLCPQGIFLPVDYEAYEAASRQFKSVLLSITTVMEDVGIDEAYLDISDEPAANEFIAEKIKTGISEKTGLTCSIGIAPNKLLAKIASDMQKPKGLTILTEADIESRIWPMPSRKLYGVGPKTEEHLRQMGIATIGQLAALPLDALVKCFGASYGQYLFEAARGIDESPLITHWEPKSFSREHTFQTDVSLANDCQNCCGAHAGGRLRSGEEGLQHQKRHREDPLSGLPYHYPCLLFRRISEKRGRENSIFYATCRRWMHGPYENDRETSEASIPYQCP